MDAAHVEPAISSVSYSNPCDRVTNNGGRNGGDKESDPCNEQTDEMHYARIRDEADSCQLLSAGLFDNALASLGVDGSAALSEDARRRRPVGMVTSDRRRGDARLFSCV